MLTKIKNAQRVKLPFVHQERKRFCEDVLNILWDEGYILGYKNVLHKDKTKIKIYLKYSGEKPVIKSLKLLSKPSKRIHYSLPQLWKINSNTSFLLVSTNKGLKTLAECKRSQIGGEPLFMIN